MAPKSKKQVKAVKQEQKDEGPLERPGRILTHQGNTFVLVNELGLGAYASVWMCYSVNKKELYAVKIFKRKEKVVAQKEIALYEKFHRMGIKNTVKHYATFDSNGQMCIVLDLMAGSLYDLIKKGGTDDDVVFKTGFGVDFVIKSLHQVLQTLVDLHANNITHGDVKPENILLYGRTKMHTEIIKTLQPKSSAKKMSDAVRELSKNFVKVESSEENSDDGSGSGEGSDESEGTENSGSGSDNESVASEMSKAPEQIVLSDEESDEIDGDNGHDGHDDESWIDDENTVDFGDADEKEEVDATVLASKKHDKHVVEHLKLPKNFIDSPIVKLSDMGACVDKNDEKKPIGVQTKYYKSPEIILGLEYGPPCDMWALGCTLYELLTGEILFNPDDYDVDKKRCILHQIYAYVGKIPKEMANASPYKQVFFTDEYTLKENDVYGDDFYQENIWSSLLENLGCGTVKKFMLLNLILDMLRTDPKKRITAKEALEHPLFKLA
ncbi:serine/threonine protein kinase [Yasminevirus sp. GU-2018]|uniref:Serine/threonine protein kinase n=1 Tax=Yasminevirus sp. GU-2018 TaxID=2420051 RepID=A0A5K0U9E8_9VIRU|nr:serine/threonine protein kinase [Yasminevirus sp. GU-2018]